MNLISGLWLRLKLRLGLPLRPVAKQHAAYYKGFYTLTEEEKANLHGYWRSLIDKLTDGIYTEPEFHSQFEPEYNRTAVYITWYQTRLPRGYGLWEMGRQGWEDISFPTNDVRP